MATKTTKQDKIKALKAQIKELSKARVILERAADKASIAAEKAGGKLYGAQDKLYALENDL